MTGMRSPLIPQLLKISPNLQTLILTWSRHFLQLGLLHPLGGGKQPLDAIVVLDAHGKRRLVLPFGWGAGRHVLDPVAGVAVKARYSEILLDSIKALEPEKHRTDSSDVSRTYF